MRRVQFAYFALSAALAALLTAPSPVSAEPRAVVELFTSQGCSSCPAADKLLGELARDPSLVVLSLPIDYWDYLGWKDTLADPRHTLRQRAYARERGDRNVYTPQVVVNGSVHALGSDKSAIEQAVTQSRRNTSALTLPVKLTKADDKLTISIPAGTEDRRGGEVWACAIAKAVPVAVERGENRGKTVTYHNVVRRWVKLADWTGKAETLTLPLGDLTREGADTVAVLIQSGTREKPGAMLGAAMLDLR
jgi:hypothetical protein